MLALLRGLGERDRRWGKIWRFPVTVKEPGAAGRHTAPGARIDDKASAVDGLQNLNRLPQNWNDNPLRRK